MNRIMAREGDMIDQIALKAYGRTKGATEALMGANPHVLTLPAKLPAGVVLDLPQIASPAPKGTVRLWD